MSHQKKLLTPDSERSAVGYVQEEYGCSQRRTCRILVVNRATARHKRIKDKDQALRARMHELAEKRKRFGAPWLHVLLKQEGLVVNHKRTERIYREEGLALRKSKPKKDVAKTRKPTEIVGGPEEYWAMDFVHDNLTNGRPIRILSIVDLWDRSCPALTVGFSQTGQNVIRTLDFLKDKGHLPKRIVFGGRVIFPGFHSKASVTLGLTKSLL